MVVVGGLKGIEKNIYMYILKNNENLEVVVSSQEVRIEGLWDVN